jgi:hypothetical protein
VRPYAAPIIETAGAIGGGLVGGTAGTFGAGPIGTAVGGVAGAGLGYGMGKEAVEAADVAMGMKAPRQGKQRITEPLENIATGAQYEMGGRILSPFLSSAISGGSQIINRLRDPKAAAYVDAVEGKGRDIINALRSPTAVIVPGSAPTTGEIAAPVGSAKFAGFVESYKPKNATEIRAMEAQTNAARLEQQARDANRFATVASKVKAKIDAGLTNVSPREVGGALIDTAKEEQKIVKRDVIQPAYTQAFNAAGNAKIDVSKVVSEAEKILERKLTDFAPETAPNTVRKLLDFIPKEQPTGPVILGPKGQPLNKPEVLPAQATLKQLDDVRKAINADIMAAKTSSTPTSDMTLRNLNILHNQIDTAVNNSTALPAEAKQLYADALAKYRTDYVPRFKTGINANLFKQTSLNEPKLNPDDVISKFFQPKGEREASQFVTLFGKNADAMQLGRTGIEDLYRQKVVDAVTGEVSPAKHAAFIRDYARPIDIMDSAGMNLQSRFDVIGRDANRLAKIQTMAKDNGVTLSAPLPAGANAEAVAQRVQNLTKGLTPRQLADVSAVARDVARENEHYVLAAAAGAPKGSAGLATKEAKELGIPAPSFLSVPITVFNAVVKRLTGKMDDKLAMEIARELSNPAVTAKMIETSMAKIKPRSNVKVIPPPVATGVINALAPRNEDNNRLRIEVVGGGGQQ